MIEYRTCTDMVKYWKDKGYDTIFEVSHYSSSIKIYLFGRKNQKIVQEVKPYQIAYIKYSYIFKPKILYYFYKLFKGRIIYEQRNRRS